MKQIEEAVEKYCIKHDLVPKEKSYWFDIVYTSRHKSKFLTIGLEEMVLILNFQNETFDGLKKEVIYYLENGQRKIK